MKIVEIYSVPFIKFLARKFDKSASFPNCELCVMKG